MPCTWQHAERFEDMGGGSGQVHAVVFLVYKVKSEIQGGQWLCVLLCGRPGSGGDRGAAAGVGGGGGGGAAAGCRAMGAASVSLPLRGGALRVLPGGGRSAVGSP